MEKNIRKIVFVLLLITTALLLRFGLEALFSFVSTRHNLTQVVGFLYRTLFLILVIIVWLSVTLRSESPTQKLPWLLLLAFEPLVGLILFLTFGRGFKKSKRYKNRPLIHSDKYITKETRASEGDIDLDTDDSVLKRIFHSAHKISYHQPFTNTTKATIYKNGETFFPELIKTLKNANTFILMEFYIIKDDTRGKEILELLMQKADSGVIVKLIGDAFGLSRLSRKMKKRLKQSAVDFIINDPIYFPLFNTRINYRNHRKIVVIDGKIGFTGGMNLADEYDNSIAYDYYFRDTQVKLEGEAVKSLTAIFFKDYYYNTNTFITDAIYYPSYRVFSQGITQVLQSGPDSNEAHIRNVYLKMIMNAETSIRIMTPYMAIDQEMLTALIVAKQSGVNVEIIIPGKPDKRLVYNVTKFYASVLLNHGINVYRYTKGFCHAKILIVDDKIASVGSYNLDNRSAVIDFEITALLTDQAVTDVVDHFILDKQDSEQLNQATWNKRFILTRLFEGLLSIFTPIL
ncbi:MAG: cardiolipin synthase [Bacillota bacterium]